MKVHPTTFNYILLNFQKKHSLAHIASPQFFFNVGLDSKLFDFLGTITNHAKFISEVIINVVFEIVRGLNEDYSSLQMIMSGLPHFVGTWIQNC